MRSTILSGVGAALAGLLLSTSLAAQMSGGYTIDSSFPTGAGNYQTFQDCANDLQSMGVSGPVVINVLPSPTPYAGFSLGAIAGTSLVNTVTIVSAAGPGSVTISGVAAGFTQTVRLGTLAALSAASAGTGPRYLVFDGFEVTGAPAGAGILLFGSTFVTIRNCTVHTSGSGIALTVSDDCVIENNEIYATNHNPGTGGSPSYSGGISLYYLCYRNLVQANRVHDCADNGIFFGSSGSTTPTPDNVCINNFIWNCGTQTSATYAGGIAMRRATNSIVANNSISMPAGSAYPAIYLMGGSTTAPLAILVCANNIVQHRGTGACIQTESLLATEIPATLDSNLYDPGSGPVGANGTSATAPTGTFANLTLWQTATSKEASSLQGPSGFLGLPDLHITPASLAFNAGSALPSVTTDIDGDPRPLGGNPDIGADETPAAGLFAGFSGSTLAGSAALSVTFTDFSYTSDPGGVTGWAWDFDNNGSIDSNSPNPTHVYGCPGVYTVALTVTDALGSNTLTRPAYITATQFQFGLTSTGFGDMVLTPVPTSCGAAMGAASGWTLASFASTLPMGSGPAFGLVPDALLFSFLFTPPAVGSIPRFLTAPGFYPDAGPLVFPPGSFSILTGVTMDGVMIFLDGAGGLLHVSNVARVTF